MYPHRVILRGRAEQACVEGISGHRLRLCVTGGWPSEDVGGQVGNRMSLGNDDSSEE